METKRRCGHTDKPGPNDQRARASRQQTNQPPAEDAHSGKQLAVDTPSAPACDRHPAGAPEPPLPSKPLLPRRGGFAYLSARLHCSYTRRILHLFGLLPQLGGGFMVSELLEKGSIFSFFGNTAVSDSCLGP
jgi:hypothetical protein